MFLEKQCFRLNSLVWCHMFTYATCAYHQDNMISSGSTLPYGKSLSLICFREMRPGIWLVGWLCTYRTYRMTIDNDQQTNPSFGTAIRYEEWHSLCCSRYICHCLDKLSWIMWVIFTFASCTILIVISGFNDSEILKTHKGTFPRNVTHSSIDISVVVYSIRSVAFPSVC